MFITFIFKKKMNYSKVFACRFFEKLLKESSVPHPPQLNTSVPHKTATPFQPPKPLGSTPKTPQFNTPFSSTSKNSVPHTGFCVELRGFLCGTERFWALRRCGLRVEPMC